MNAISDDFPDANICVVGLGYVGLTLAVVLAGIGFHVEGVEINEEVAKQLREGRPHFFEPGLQDRMTRLVSSGKLKVSREIAADSAATVFIVTVGTPLDKDGRIRLDMISHAAGEIAAKLKAGDLVIMRSTVRLGTTRDVVMPILKKAGVPFDIAFCPERTVEGQALAELKWLPQVVGASSIEARVRAARLFNFITPTVVQVPSIEVAEMIKLIDNTYRDVTFAFANEVAGMCEAANINICDVINGGKLGYPRTNLPMPGPVGGPCLEKDPHILAESVRAYGFEPQMVATARRLNEQQPATVVAHIKAHTDSLAAMPDAPTIALMGLAFKGKPATDDLRGTMAKPILAALRGHYPRATFRGFDAMVTPDEVRRVFQIEPAASLEAAMRGAHLVVIANNHPCFPAMPLERLADGLSRPAVIYDFWNNFDARDLVLPMGVDYVGLGVGKRSAAS
jgi:nucleotide sugar dehydrogenase